jgi:hypothetical protein
MTDAATTDEWLTAVADRGLPEPAVAVAGALAAATTDGGTELIHPPTIPTLAAATGLDQRVVRAACNQLRDGGYVVASPRRDECGGQLVPTPLQLKVPITTRTAAPR